MSQATSRAPFDTDAIEAALSLERFARYVLWAQGDRIEAIRLYSLNTCLSEALYVPLQALEISLRNRIHDVMTEAKGSGWFLPERGIVDIRQASQVQTATHELSSRSGSFEDSHIVAALTFSFWTAMFGRHHDLTWKEALHRIAKRDGRYLARKDFSAKLTQVRLLRNRIAHHEPILYWDLSKQHASMIELTRWLSPAMDVWRASLDRFEAVYPHNELPLLRGVRSSS